MNETDPGLVAEFANVSPRSAWSRRDFVVSTLAAGFAMAVQPVAAQTITTDAKGLTAGEVRIPVKGGEIPAYRAMPAEGKDLPLILVVQEIFGVHEHIRDVCRRLAKLGYMAVAPELYARQGNVSKLSDMKEIMAVVEKVPDLQVMHDLDDTMSWSRKNGANVTQLGITGFCWGGRIVWLYCAHNLMTQQEQVPVQNGATEIPPPASGVDTTTVNPEYAAALKKCESMTGARKAACADGVRTKFGQM